MHPIVAAIVTASGVFIAMLASLELGFRWGRRDLRQASHRAHEGIGAIEASAFALLGLLLGFSFAAASARLETMRTLIVAEARQRAPAIDLPRLDVGRQIGREDTAHRPRGHARD